MMFLCTLATKWAKISRLVSTVKWQNYIPCLGIFSAKPYPMFRNFFKRKSHPLEWHTPVYLIRRVPPPPPPPPGTVHFLDGCSPCFPVSWVNVGDIRSSQVLSSVIVSPHVSQLHANESKWLQLTAITL